MPLREPMMVQGVGRALRWLPETDGSEKRSPSEAKEQQCPCRSTLIQGGQG